MIAKVTAPAVVFAEKVAVSDVEPPALFPKVYLSRATGPSSHGEGAGS
jgi:hypothetical protein